LANGRERERAREREQTHLSLAAKAWLTECRLDTRMVRVLVPAKALMAVDDESGMVGSSTMDAEQPMPGALAAVAVAATAPGMGASGMSPCAGVFSRASKAMSHASARRRSLEKGAGMKL